MKYLNGILMRLMMDVDDGDARMRKADELIAIPSQIDGLVAERVANYVILRAEGLGFTIRWDTKV